MSIDWDEMTMEAHLFPWLDSDCMADPTEEEFPFNIYEDECEDSDES